MIKENKTEEDKKERVEKRVRAESDKNERRACLEPGDTRVHRIFAVNARISLVKAATMLVIVAAIAIA